MGKLSLIIGIIVFLTALFPNLGYFIIVPATFGLIAGGCRLAKQHDCYHAIAGIILNYMAIILALFWTAILAFTTIETIEAMLSFGVL